MLDNPLFMALLHCGYNQTHTHTLNKNKKPYIPRLLFETKAQCLFFFSADTCGCLLLVQKREAVQIIIYCLSQSCVLASERAVPPPSRTPVAN
jgi:hypothetical protein